MIVEDGLYGLLWEIEHIDKYVLKYSGTLGTLTFVSLGMSIFAIPMISSNSFTREMLQVLTVLDLLFAFSAIIGLLLCTLKFQELRRALSLQ